MPMFRGFNACACLVRWLPVFEAELLRRGVIKHNIDIAQLIGGAAVSGGTHTKGGAFDIWQHDKITIYVARQMGADADWSRTRAQGFDPHSHGVLRGCPHNTPARYQITAVDDGYNGLGYAGRGGRDDGPRPLSERTWQEGIAWAEAQQPKPFGLRVGIYNIPDGSKIPNAAARIQAGAELVDSAKLDVLGINEAVGRRGKGRASSHAVAIHAAVQKATGMSWTLTIPTTDLNENYILTKDATVKVASQWGDTIVRASGVPGRHVTRIVGRHVATKRKFAFGVTHLVNDNRPGTQKQSPLVAKAVTDIGKKHDCPVIIVGDMNNSADLTGFSKAGLVNTRKKAKAATNGQYATYTNIEKTKPSTNLDWRIDQIWSSRDGLTVTGQTLKLAAPGGTFTKPRPSDHGLLLSALVYA